MRGPAAWRDWAPARTRPASARFRIEKVFYVILAARMDILVLSHHDVVALLPMSDCIELMSEALSALARGEVTNPLRSVMRPEGTRHFFGLMPAYRGGGNPAYALKEVCIFPG